MGEIDRRLDMLGEVCPRPIIEMAKAIRGMNVGQRLWMIADDPVAEKDIRAWIKASRHTLARLERRGDVIEVEIEKAR